MIKTATAKEKRERVKKSRGRGCTDKKYPRDRFLAGAINELVSEFMPQPSGVNSCKKGS